MNEIEKAIDKLVEADRGTIWLKRKYDQWTGKTSADKSALRQSGCPSFFDDDEYDEVLRKVSARGFDLSTPIGDEKKGEDTE